MTKLEVAYVIIMLISFCCDSLEISSKESSMVKIAVISSIMWKIIRVISVMAIFYFRYWR